MNYALRLQFLDRLEVSGKINGGEKVWLGYLLEDNDGNPNDGDILDSIKELRKLKVVVYRYNLFAVSLGRKKNGVGITIGKTL